MPGVAIDGRPVVLYLETLVPAPHKQTENTDLAIIGPRPWPSHAIYACKGGVVGK